MTQKENNYYRFTDHTADAAVESEASSLSELFRLNYDALREVLYGTSTISDKDFHDELKITLSEDTDEELLINFLNEMNFVINVKKLLCGDLTAITVENHRLSCSLKFSENPESFNLKHEVKSVTHHGVYISFENGLYKTKIVYDI